MGGHVFVEAGLVRDLRVAGGEIEQPPLLSAPRHDQVHPSPRLRRQPAFEHLGVRIAEPDGQVDLRRRGAVGVELLQRRLQDVAFSGLAFLRRSRPRIERLPDLGTELGNELGAFDHAAAAHLKNLDHRAGRAQLEPERVAIAELDPRHLLLPRTLRLDRPDRIAQLGGLLEPLGGRRLGHPVAQSGHELVAPPFEKELRVLDRHPVFLLGAQLPDARGDAPLDVVLQARAAALTRNRLVARPNPEQPVSQRHRPAPERGRQVGAGVVVVVPLDAAGDEHPRERLARRQLQVRVVLVVPKQDVVLRAALLDEVILEGERLDDRVGDDDLEALRFVQQRIDPRAHALRAEVAPHPVAQDARLSDVQRVARLVVIEVDARLLRKTRYLGLEIADRHALHCEFWRSSEPFIIARGTRHS